jgi:putative ABC transport system permease protein
VLSGFRCDQVKGQSMNKLVISNLLHRPLRSLISTFAVAIEVIMILSVVAIFMGMLHDQRQRTNGIGADLMMMGSHASIFNSLSAASMPVNDAIALRRLPHVAVVSPAVQHSDLTTSSLSVIYGIDFASFNAMRPFSFVSGGPFQGPDDAIIDTVWAGAHNLHVGSAVKVMGHEFRVSGVVEPGKGGRTMLPLETLDNLLGTPGKASIFYIKCDTPANDGLVTNEILSTPGLQNNEVLSMSEVLSQFTPANLPGVNEALGAVTAIAVIVGFLVIFQAMYTAVLERTREIGILKSMGASKPAIVSVVLRESAILAIAGVLVGIGGTFLLRFLLHIYLPTIPYEITPGWAARAAAIAFGGALGGAIYPAWMAARKDPVDALAYE